jgi:hypothetical protein
VPLHGFPVFVGFTRGWTRDAFRFSLAPDRSVPYDRSIEARIEHGPGNDVPANYRSAVFFYDTRPDRVSNDTPVIRGDECVAYLERRIWQMAADDPASGLKKLNELLPHCRRPEEQDPDRKPFRIISQACLPT